MEQQDHSNGNGALHHQTTSGTTSNPSFRVYVDMAQEHYSNSSAVYKDSDGEETKTCIDSLKDAAHYKFSCRCGCGAKMAGYGRDIKAASKLGRDLKPEPVSTITHSCCSGTTMLNMDNIQASTANTNFQIYDGLQKPPAEDEEVKLPFVSDRYLKKAMYNLSDHEINDYHTDRPDPLEAQGVNLAERQPPAIGDLVYSLATGEGPYTLLEYKDHEVKLDDGGVNRLLCGVCRTGSGRYVSLPLADLSNHRTARPKTTTRRWGRVASVIVMLAASIAGSAIAVAYHML